MSFTPARSVVLTKDPTGAGATDLSKVRDQSPDLAKASEKAGFALSKVDELAGIRAQAVALVDHSGSMRSDYESQAVQKLLTRFLGFALQIDADGKVPVIAFDTKVHPAVEVTTSNFSSAVADSIYKPNEMGLTNLADALKALKNMAETTDEPIFAAIITDGEPSSDKRVTTQLVCELAAYPVFLKFLAVRPVDYLSELDDLGNDKRLLDNVDSKPEKGTALNLLSCTDAEFMAALVDEWDTWVVAATAAGVLKS
jgi:hypothetical protein